jgi:large conductance mechanosensitive channel
MGLIKEFKAFALKGNVVDMAVGIVIGGAFGKIVASLVGDVIMPLVGSLTGGGSLGRYFLWLGKGDKPASIEAAKATGEAYIAWGPFVQTTVDFLIIAVAIFLMVKAMNRARSMVEWEKEETPAEPTTKTCEFCQSSIPIKATRCPNCTSQLATG